MCINKSRIEIEDAINDPLGLELAARGSQRCQKLCSNDVVKDRCSGYSTRIHSGLRLSSMDQFQ